MAWRDADRWQSLRDSAGCPICVAGRPDHLLVELPASWVTAGREAPLAGYACVISKVHAVEPFELLDRGLAFWGDAVRVAEALNAELRPVKMNYEIHGNTIPHLHMHLYPREADDPFVGRPIDASAASVVRSTADLEAMRAAVERATQPTPPLAAVGVVVRRDDEVLLATHSYHADKRYVLIAGYVEPGESVEEAAVREVAEETGLEVIVDRLLGSYSWQPGGLPILFIACEARVTGGTLRLSEELEDARWFELSSLPTWPAGFPVADIMARLLQEA